MKKIVILLFAAFTLQPVAFSQRPPYKNKKLSPEVRTKDLLSRMTLEEKLMQLQCIWGQKSAIMTNGHFDETKAEKSLKNGLGEIARINDDRGPANPGLAPKEAALLYNMVQKFFVEKTRLGIPVMIHEEGLHGQQAKDATSFPTPMGLASSWNENLVTEIYTHVAEEIRARGGQQVLAPVVDVVRDPRWGRTEETMGEDPFLISRLAVAQVKAYQGNSVYLDDSHVAATLKHFGVHGQSEGGNNTAPSNVDELSAREVFFPPFKACIQEAGAMNVMSSYNELWGMPAHANKKLLTDILKKEWGFKGVIVSDYGGVSNLKNIDKITPSTDEAGYLAFKAGIDTENPDPESFKNLKQYVLNGKISMKELDDAVTRILVNKFRVSLFDDPYVDADKAEQIVGSPQKRAIAYKAATESMVLLKNDNNILPLDKNIVKTIAFIGPNADKCILGGYSSVPRVCISPLQALKEKYGSQMKVLYAEGVKITDTDTWSAPQIKLASMEENQKRMADAVAVAKQADVIVLFVGSNAATSREGWDPSSPGDLSTLELLSGQNDLIDQIVALGKPTCAFVNSGPPLSIGHLVEAVPAVVQGWFLGQEGGYAMIDALFGDVNPSGKLPISFPRSAGHIPAYYSYKPSSRRGYNVGLDVSPLFPFGYGLSYTTFQYSNLTISAPTMKKNGTATVRVDVKNTGNRSGAEVVQLYIRDEFSSVPRPVKELKGFKKIGLEPGQSQTVTFRISPELLAFYDKDMKWVVEPGDFTIMVGTSSHKTDSIRLKVTE
ncbi:MAG: beta-glucosidase [Ferruginibacter sp.]|uniref:glycoside hydrolase family 3 N-terminal domain-containing protein n=1 Tax=Ferruginibacter sp. TaxID=1940288 RepID=UPI002658BB46|nr:glycoside hydrolase family 3 N-terminal domain-containing protein [Ferruginibacter sp.]MDB5279621.1 beta-glucosidase [Ferruginibacter sp.]